MSSPGHILFLCANNGVRSHMATELVCSYGATDFEVESASLHPQAIHSEVLAVLAEHGIETRCLHSKHVHKVKVHAFDGVISLCDRGRLLNPR